MTYYKATRPDGTDFYAGAVDYAGAMERGETLVHPAKFERNKPSSYFSIATVPTDCVGMRWPCRLFEVEAVSRAYRNDKLPNKRCVTKLRVVRELDPHLALGPQGREVAAIIERCRSLTAEKIRKLAAAGAAARDAAGTAAWDAAWDAARAAARAAARTAAGAAAGDAAWDAAWAAAGAAAGDAAWDAAGDAAGDAAWAVLTRDLIGTRGYTQEHHDLLMKSWLEVIGE